MGASGEALLDVHLTGLCTVHLGSLMLRSVGDGV